MRNVVSNLKTDIYDKTQIEVDIIEESGNVWGVRSFYDFFRYFIRVKMDVFTLQF